ncbi:Argininosuccinate synthase [Planctomycetes bacterium Pan216]|uniref:Argininosuccinate synthase n=1 Tax=Kolteria novifilia TaxID=2527975 RepID=A0A518AXS7_9BACT|nr:Argininosuccinate synthase [Planctomycetes bacterium Pan216]
MANEKCILAYSGGLDTSIMVPWIKEKYGFDVVTFTADLGQGVDLESVRQKALKTGAIDAEVTDARAMFMDYFVVPALMANTLYEGKYPLATALGRPLIAWMMVEIAKKHGAVAVAHGCTGKGNDQVRFDVTFRTLAPELRIVAPVREWKMSRPEALEYAAKHKIEVKATSENPYSIDENIWGRSVECGELEDPWAEPPVDAYEWTTDPGAAPDEGAEVTIGFAQGRPVSLDGKETDVVEIVEKLNEIGGKNGIGRIDLVENRLVGIKSRELYEAPGAIILTEAHQEIERLVLSRESHRFKTLVSQEYADLIYNGLWFSALHQDLMAYVASSQRYVTGEVRLKLFKGSIILLGRRSEHSLYRKELATYDKEDDFDHEAAQGFIRLWGLSQQTQAKTQLLTGKRGFAVPDVLPPSTSDS